MPDDPLVEAIRLAGPGCFYQQPTGEDWQRVEKDFGVRLPVTYKRFVSAFGSGVFGLDLYVLNPAGSEKNVRLCKPWLAQHSSQMQSHIAKLPTPYFDGSSGLFPVASTTSQIDLAFSVRNGAMLDEVTIVYLGVRELDETGLSLCQLILTIYRGEQDWSKDLRDCLWGVPSEPFFHRWEPVQQRIASADPVPLVKKEEPDLSTLHILERRALEQVLTVDPSVNVDKCRVETFNGHQGSIVSFTILGQRGDGTPMQFDYQFGNDDGEWTITWKCVQWREGNEWLRREG